MGLDRRTLLTGAGAAVAGTLAGPEPAHALRPVYTNAVVLFNRMTGRWRREEVLTLSGGNYDLGTDTAQFVGLTSYVGVRRRTPTTPSNVFTALLTLRGTETSLAWQTIFWSGLAWEVLSRFTLSGSFGPWNPALSVVDDDAKRVRMFGGDLATSIDLSLVNGSATSWRLLHRGSVAAPPLDTRYRAAILQADPASRTDPKPPAYIYGMLKGGKLTQFIDANSSVNAAPSLAVNSTRTTTAGHVYGPIFITGFGYVLLVYNPATGQGQFVQLNSVLGVAGAIIRVDTPLGVGWNNIVPCRVGWYLYDRTLRRAQIVTIAPSTASPTGAELQTGPIRGHGSMEVYTDAIGFH